MALLIKKVVDLSQLGESYQGISLIFRSIPATDLADVEAERRKLTLDKDEENADLTVIMPFFVRILQKYFVGGQQDEEKVVAEDLVDLDSDGLIYCFQILTGQDIDPKEDSSSTTVSTTEQNNQ